MGLKLRAFVEIAQTSQSREEVDRFEQAVADFDDILECHLMSGNADYILRTAARDVEEFDQNHRSRLPGMSSMRSSFAIRTIKGWRGFLLQ